MSRYSAIFLSCLVLGGVRVDALPSSVGHGLKKRFGTGALNPPMSVVTAHAAYIAEHPDAVSSASAAAPVARTLTNAERMKRGLPPNPPVRRSKSDVAQRPRRSAAPSPSATGYVQVFESSNSIGYVKTLFNSYGEYGYLCNSTDGALQVTFAYSSALPTTSQVSIATLNGPNSNYSTFGAIEGFSSTDTLSTSTSDYTYIGGTVVKAASAVPASGGNTYTTTTGLSVNIESAIWTYTTATNALTAQWVNPDSSLPTAHIVYSNTDNLFALTGNVSSFDSTFPSGDEVTFQFVSI